MHPDSVLLENFNGTSNNAWKDVDAKQQLHPLIVPY